MLPGSENVITSLIPPKQPKHLLSRGGQVVPVWQGLLRVLMTCFNQIGIASKLSFVCPLQGGERNGYII